MWMLLRLQWCWLWLLWLLWVTKITQVTRDLLESQQVGRKVFSDIC
jgi:hypothetical protein